MRQEVVVVEEEREFYTPDNCWAIVEENGKRRLVVGGTFRAKQGAKIVLIPKVAGG